MEREYKKMSCPKCVGHIEYPADNFGERIFCPHCGSRIELGMDSSRTTNAAPLDTFVAFITDAYSRMNRVGKVVSLFASCIAVWLIIELFSNANPTIVHTGSNPNVVNSTPISSQSSQNVSYSAPSPGVTYYQTQIQDGLKAFDPNYKPTPNDELLILSTAQEADKQYPK
jgi:hypothetical protein